MMPAMNMPAMQMPMQMPMQMQMPQAQMMPGMMPMMSMMPGMPGMMMGNMMMPAMMPMMGNMMMPGMMPMMGGMMMPMVPVMCRMTMEMGKDGVTCKVTPMDGTSMETLKERCEAMMKTLSMGMPMTMMCGGGMLMCMPATK